MRIEHRVSRDEYRASSIEQQNPVIVFLNGQFVPESEARVSVFDRSFQYGDGLFETIRISGGRPFRWAQHLERLERGARFLQIQVPFGNEELEAAMNELVQLDAVAEAVLRIALSRGAGQRGYSPAGADQPLLVMSLHPTEPMPVTPENCRCFTSTLRLVETDPLTGFKTNNKLVQVMARAEAEQNECDEALLLNTRGEVCETSSGNVFWVEGDCLLTPPVEAGPLPGVTRATVLELAPTLRLTTDERSVKSDTLLQANGAFVTLSSRGIVEIVALDGNALQTSRHTASLYQAYRRLVAEETRRTRQGSTSGKRPEG